MLNKLVFRNVKRCFRDYLVYIVTVTMCFSLVFAFNLLAFSNDLRELSREMGNFKYAIMFVSIIVIFVIGWLINYTMNFMLERRSKEFGIYMLLGIEKRDINKMFVRENIILGFISFVISFFGGILISVLLTGIIMRIFDMPYKVNLSISYKSVILSFVYFVVIYVYVLFGRNRQIKGMKIYDMLYYEKINERGIWNNKSINVFSFICFIIMGIVGVIGIDYFCVNIGSSYISVIILFVGIILIIFSIYGITFSLGDFILSYVLRCKGLKYRGDNLFITRNFVSKVRTMGSTFGTLSLLIFMTLSCMILAFMMRDGFLNNVNQYAPYDIIVDTLYSETFDGYDFRYKLDDYREYIDSYYTIEEEFSYDLYVLGDSGSDEESPIQMEIKELSESNGIFQNDVFISLSDYNKLQEMLGRDKLVLDDDEYFIHGALNLKEELEDIGKEKYELNINGVLLGLRDVWNTNYLEGWGKNGMLYIIIVPDDVVDGLMIWNRFVVFDTLEETSEEFYNMISKDLSRYEYNGKYHTEVINAIRVRGYYLAQNRSFMTIFSFSFLYLSLIFIAVVGTVISIRTLSDGVKYRYRYSLLRKLGVNNDRIYRIVRKQVFINFLFPVVYPLIISIFFSISINKLLGDVISSEYMYIYVWIYSLLIFGIIYFVYYLVTYFGIKRDVEE